MYMKTRDAVITFVSAPPTWSVRYSRIACSGSIAIEWILGATSISSCCVSSTAVSHTTTRFPRLAATRARHAATVVLPTPPFPVTKTRRLSRRKGTYPSEYRPPYGPVRTKEFQSAGVSAVTFVRDQRSCGPSRDPAGRAAGGIERRAQGPSDLVRQPEGWRGEDHYHPESRGRIRRKGQPRAVRRPGPAVEPDDEPGHRPRLARDVDVRRAREPRLDPRGHPQAGDRRGVLLDRPGGSGDRDVHPDRPRALAAEGVRSDPRGLRLHLHRHTAKPRAHHHQ